jgi:murein DD-endopeptidase MepM/ murein hydrolase activator NlpD
MYGLIHVEFPFQDNFQIGIVKKILDPPTSATAGTSADTVSPPPSAEAAYNQPGAPAEEMGEEEAGEEQECPPWDLMPPFAHAPYRTDPVRWRDEHPTLGAARGHYGIDLRGNGQPLFSPCDGVIYGADGSGNSIEIKQTHPQTGEIVIHRLMHMKDPSPWASKIGDPISKGEFIGNIDSTGGVTGPHLHWEMKYASRGGRPLDPAAEMVRAGYSNWKGLMTSEKWLKGDEGEVKLAERDCPELTELSEDEQASQEISFGEPTEVVE